MIPESIKIDDNGDFEINKTIYGYDYDDHGINVIINFTFEEIEEAYLLAKSKKEQQNKPIKYACHVDADKGDGEVYDMCCLEDDPYECTFAVDLYQRRKCKTDCQYWRQI